MRAMKETLQLNKALEEIIDQRRREWGRQGEGRVPPSAFDESFLRFWEKVSLKLSPILGENSSKILQNQEKIHQKLPKTERKFVENPMNLRENFSKLSQIGRKFVENSPKPTKNS